MCKSLPVLIVGYARPENTNALILECIKNNVNDIYISLDGANTAEVESLQSKLLQYINEFENLSNVKIVVLKRNSNIGPGASVITALDWVFTFVDAVIVLEDDLEVDGQIFKYMSENIETLRLKNSYLMLAGTQLNSSKDNQITFSNIPIVWGWAITKSKWGIARNLILSKSIDLRKIKSIRRRIYWYLGRKKALMGLIDAWDVPLAAAMVAEGFECLLPPCNLVTNNGFDSLASHTRKQVWPLGLPRKVLSTEFPNLNTSISMTRMNNKFIEKRILNLNFRMFIRNLISIARLSTLKRSVRGLETLESKVIQGWNLK